MSMNFETDVVIGSSNTLSKGRKANSTVGTGSFAFGNNVTASGMYSFAEGYTTTASGSYSHAEGGLTQAKIYAHAEGYTTKAHGECSHAEGFNTTAQRKSQHVGGEYNVLDSTGTESTHGTYVEIIGNGTADDARSNARTLDWSGNERLNGDLYVNCNDDSTGGTKVVATAFTGATSSTAGAIGLVPAPASGDHEKFLRGDGTWATASGGGGSALLTPSAAFSIPGEGTSVTYSMTGMTANHELIRWNFSNSAENAPPVSLEWTTGEGYFTILNTSGDTNETMKPVFAETVGTSITQYIE